MTQTDTPALTVEDIKLIEILVDVTNPATIENKCKEANVSRCTYYRRMKDPVFRAYYELELNNIIKVTSSAVIRALIRKASSGDVPAMRLYFERAGELKGEQDRNVTISFVELKRNGKALDGAKSELGEITEIKEISAVDENEAKKSEIDKSNDTSNIMSGKSGSATVGNENGNRS